MRNRQRVLRIFERALRLSRLSVWLGGAAIAVFLVCGTLASLPAFAQSAWVYACFFWLPCVFVGLSAPISVYQAFLLWRYRAIQAPILALALAMGFFGVGVALFFWWRKAYGAAVSTQILAQMVWLAMPFLFRVNARRYVDFLKKTQTPDNE